MKTHRIKCALKLDWVNSFLDELAQLRNYHNANLRNSFDVLPPKLRRVPNYIADQLQQRQYERADLDTPLLLPPLQKLRPGWFEPRRSQLVLSLSVYRCNSPTLFELTLERTALPDELIDTFPKYVELARWAPASLRATQPHCIAVWEVPEPSDFAPLEDLA